MATPAETMLIEGPTGSFTDLALKLCREWDITTRDSARMVYHACKSAWLHVVEGMYWSLRHPSDAPYDFPQLCALLRQVVKDLRAGKEPQMSPISNFSRDELLKLDDEWHL